MRAKVTIVGSGNVGAAACQQIFEKRLANVTLLDVVEGSPQGKALDLMQSGPIEGLDCRIEGTNDYAASSDSDIVIITAGLTRKPGMSRNDLVLNNHNIVKGVTQNVIRYSPQCILIVVTNPLDAMAQTAFNVSGFPRGRVLGMAGALDSSRFRYFIAREADVSVDDVQAFVMGSHGDTMVPVIRYSTIAGIPIHEILPKEKVDCIIQRTRDAGAEIVSLLKSGSAFFAPAASIVEMVEAILYDKKRIIPCSVYLEGEYGIRGIFTGVPIKLGRNGMEKIIEIKLTSNEQAALFKSSHSVTELMDIINASSS